MKIVLRVLGFLVAVLAIAIGAVYVMSGQRFGQRFDVTPAAVAVPTDDAGRAEGLRLYFTRGCADCHDVDLGGKTVIDDFMVGRIAGTNLTSGTGGIGTRADLDLVRAIRHGVAPDGRPLLFMPAHEFNPLSDLEVGAMIAAIRAAPPVDRASVTTTSGPLMRLLFLLGEVPAVVSAELIDHKAPRPPPPVVGPTAAYGAYLANLCMGCHGNGLSGGAIPGAPPDWPVATNITTDPATGLGGWTAEDFARAIRTGTRKDGTAIDPVMPWRNFSKMTDDEITALWLHLRTVPPRAAGTR